MVEVEDGMKSGLHLLTVEVVVDVPEVVHFSREQFLIKVKTPAVV